MENKKLLKEEKQRIKLEKQLIKRHIAESKKQEREEKKRLRLELKQRNKEEKALKKVNKPTEKELVHKYVDKVFKNKQSHGWIDERFKELRYDKQVNKDLWLDTDFFFSVVFQSKEQKYEFLKKLKILDNWDYQVQIINGLEFAKILNIELTKESKKDFPLRNLELQDLVLDYSIDDK